MNVLAIIFIAVALIAGVVAGFIIANSKLNKSTVLEKQNLIKEAEVKAEAFKQEKILQAKEKFLQLKAEHDKTVNERNQQLSVLENKAKQREGDLAKKIEEATRKDKDLENQKNQLNSQVELYKKKSEEIEKSHRKQVEMLEKVSGLSADEAKAQLIESVKAEAKTEAMSFIKDSIDEAKLTANKEAKRIVIQTIQRVATEHAIENAVTVFHIDNDEVKGRVIGREGRNIRALEAATGIEIIVDDTPEAIILSGFDPVRRELARLALHQLVSDGRIHPARIEEVVAKVRRQLDEEIIETGKRTAIDLGIHGLAPELIRMVGRMKYRSSYGQNLLQHSREVANLCALMAAELGLNVKLAKRAGLLHDIGKVAEEDTELPHAIAGMKMAERAKENPEVINAIGAHHDEIEMTSMISPIIQVCDAISGARPGARREIVEQYMKRLKEMEGLAQSYKGVEKAFAIQAGRELRVIVEDRKSTRLNSSH